MKHCSVCGCSNVDEATRCEICGVAFSKVRIPQKPSPSAAPLMPQPEPAFQPQNNPEDQKADRMAIAGFVLSLMGAVTVMTSPLQLAALILSIASGKTKKFRRLRFVGILLSSVVLGISLILWLLIGIHADAVFTYLNNATNEFFY